MSESTFELTKDDLCPFPAGLCCDRLPLSNLIPAHLGRSGNQSGGCWDHSDVGSVDRRCHGPFDRRDI